MFKRKKDTHERLVHHAIANGLLEVLYIGFVVLVMSLTQNAFTAGGFSGLLGVATFLMFFVLSAGVSAVLIFGYPARYLAEKKYEEAVIFSLIALGTVLLVFFVFLLLGLFFYR